MERAERWTNMHDEYRDRVTLDRIGTFVLGERLRSGPCGDVYLAHADANGPDDAVTVHLIDPAAYADTFGDGALAAFVRRAEALQRFDAAGIARVHEAGNLALDNATCPYVVQERVDGPPITTFADAMELGTRGRIELLIGLCETIAPAHDAGLVHGAIDPRAIRVPGHGPPVVLFLVDHAGDGSIAVDDPREDVRALAGVGRALLDGNGSTDAVELVESVLAQADDADPGRRPVSAGALADALRAALAGDAPAHAGDGVPWIEGAWRYRAWIGAAAAVVMVSASLLWWASAKIADARHASVAAARAQQRLQAERADAVSAAEAARRDLAAAEVARRNAERDRGMEIERRALAVAAREAAESMRDLAFVSGTVWGLRSGRHRTSDEAPQGPASASSASSEPEPVQANAATRLGAGGPQVAREQAYAVMKHTRDMDMLLEEARGELAVLQERAARAESRAAKVQAELNAERRAAAAAAEERAELRALAAAERGRADEAAARLVDLARERDEAARVARSALVQTIDDVVLDDLLTPAHGRRGRPGTDRVALDRIAGNFVGAFEEDPLAEAILRQRIARAYAGNHRPDLAIAHAERALELFRSEHGPEDAKTMRALDEVVAMAIQAGRYEHAAPAARTRLDLLAQTLEPDDERIVDEMHRLAFIELRRGRADLAEPLLVKTIDQRRRLNGDADERTLELVEALAGLYAADGRYDEAEARYVMTVDIRRQMHGDDDERTRASLQVLAELLLHRGRYEEAEDHLRELIAITRRLYGDDDWRVASATSDLGAALLAQDRYDESATALLAAFDALMAVEEAPEARRRVTVERLVSLYDERRELVLARRWRGLLP